MTDFNRETRYIVVKLARLNHEARQAVIDFLQSWHVPTEECAVVEHDWPNYEHTWKTIQQVAEGTFDPGREADLLEELERRKEQITSAAKAIQDLQYENHTLRELHSRDKETNAVLLNENMKLREQFNSLREALITCHNAHPEFYDESPEICQVITSTAGD